MVFGKGAAAPIVSIIDLKGEIAAGKSICHDRLASAIDKAFNIKGVSAVALDINSPGGSPTQSEIIANHIRRRSEETGIPVYGFTQDIAASGGYWLACAADEIFAPKTATIGSIGVITQGFDFSDLMSKLGVKERTYTAGTNKSRMSPFKPAEQKDIDWIENYLSEMHEMFKDWVKERRDGKFDSSLDLDNDVFNADIWHAKKAADIGLIDGIGELVPVMQKKLNANNIKFVRVVKGPGLMSIFNMAAKGLFNKHSGLDLDSEAVGKGIAKGLVEAAKKEQDSQPDFKLK
jgi:signal peptide peptidase SppA